MVNSSIPYSRDTRFEPRLEHQYPKELFLVGFEVLTTVVMNVVFFFDIAPLNLVKESVGFSWLRTGCNGSLINT
jgi:hypothetical protein